MKNFVAIRDVRPVRGIVEFEDDVLVEKFARIEKASTTLGVSFSRKNGNNGLVSSSTNIKILRSSGNCGSHPRVNSRTQGVGERENKLVGQRLLLAL